MYVDPKVMQKEKNLQRFKDIIVLVILAGFIFFEYQAVQDLLVRLTHDLVVIETNQIFYEPSGLGLSRQPAIQYQWKGVDYRKSVGGLFMANSSLIAAPVKMLVDPESPQVAVLKTPYGGWLLWSVDFLILQGFMAGFLYFVFVSPYRLRKKSYFH